MGVFGSRWTAAQTRLINREARCEFRHLFAHALLDLGVSDIRENFRDPGADRFHFRFAHAARGYRRAAQADSAALHRRGGARGICIFFFVTYYSLLGSFLLSASHSPRIR